MNMPGFTADASLAKKPNGIDPRRTLQRYDGLAPGPARIVMARRFGGFGPTLPTCHWEKQMVVCGSALPGYPPPMCPEWVYVCKFPGSSRNLTL